MAINIGLKGHAGVAKAFLDNLQWQFETAVSPPINAPACIEMAIGMKGILWPASLSVIPRLDHDGTRARSTLE